MRTSTETDETGRASVTRTLGSSADTQTTSASVDGLAGYPVTFVQTATAVGEAQVKIVSGNDQSAPAGSLLSAPLVVQLLDRSNNPILGQVVTWVIGTGGGSVSQASSTTDTQGQASTSWTLGTSPGRNSLSAVVSGVGTLAFTATGT